MEERKAFMFFRSFYEAASMLTNKEEQAEYFMAICRYALDGELPELTGTPAAMFALTKPNLDVSRERAKAGKKGGSTSKANGKQTLSKTEAKAEKPEAIKDKGQGIKNKGLQDKGDIPPKSPAGGTQEQAFEEFWKLYPRKKSKGQAKRAWDKIKPNGEIISAIMEKLPVLINSPDWKKDGGQYIPYPATWLNAEGWLDEPKQNAKSLQSQRITTPRVIDEKEEEIFAGLLGFTE